MKIEDIIPIILIIFVLIFGFNIYLKQNPGYTIQDVYVYCSKNPDVLITHRGDDCNNTMNNIYNENENWTRYIDQTK